MRTAAALAACAALFLASAAKAESVQTAIGSFEAPDGLQVMERKEEGDGGIIVFTLAGDLPRAVFIVTYVKADPGAEPFDARDSAVKIGNPFDPSLTPSAAHEVKVGDANGASWDGILPNGLRGVSYVAEKGEFRLIVLLKGPNQKPYKGLIEDFGKAIEHFQWKSAAATAPAAAAPAPAAG